jgi:hypothetical protein
MLSVTPMAPCLVCRLSYPRSGRVETVPRPIPLITKNPPNAMIPIPMKLNQLISMLQSCLIKEIIIPTREMIKPIATLFPTAMNNDLMITPTFLLHSFACTNLSFCRQKTRKTIEEKYHSNISILTQISLLKNL